jgi:hypothetical protein
MCYTWRSEEGVSRIAKRREFCPGREDDAEEVKFLPAFNKDPHTRM